MAKEIQIKAADEESRLKKRKAYILRAVDHQVFKAFGFIADIHKTTSHNAANYLAQMSPWAYFNRPTNMAFHDLTSKINPPKNLRTLLGLSLKFILCPRYNTPWATYEDITLPRFNHDFRIKAYMADKLDLNEDEDNTFNARLYTRSDWNPPDHLFPFPRELPRRLLAFQTFLQGIVTRTKCKPNLLPHQCRALDYLRNQTSLLVVQCDKNLGPAVIEREAYIKLVIRDHLSDTTTYQRLSSTVAATEAKRLWHLLTEWIKKHKAILTKYEHRFLCHHLNTNKEPFATFYATMKVHKHPLKTHPIVSCSGSLLAAIGVWVDDKLQKAARAQQSYFKSSFDLKKELSALTLPSGCLLFTADAESMYTNIPTHRTLLFIGQYLQHEQFPDIPVEALMEALHLVMTNNIFTFSDTTWKQMTGTAMGTPPAPPWATLYYALLENDFLPRFEGNLLLYRRFIDDVFGIWQITDHTTNAARWDSFKLAMNDVDFALTWIVSDPAQTVNFMDLTISLCGDKLHLTLYEKPSNLHLYIPPHSCHPPGLLAGVVHGMIFRIHTLCSDDQDKTTKAKTFFHQLRQHGNSTSQLQPLFHAAIDRATNQQIDPSAVPNHNKLRHTMFFHLRYHPQNPASRVIQNGWRNYIAEPAYTRPLANMRNYAGQPLGISRLIVAYNRSLNLGNLLSYRKLKPNTGPPVSSYLD